MKHLYNTTENGIYQDHNGNIIRGPKLHKTMPKTSSTLIFNRTWGQIKTMQQGKKA